MTDDLVPLGEMQMWNWISAVGVLIEFVGFGMLAWDLWRSARESIEEANAIAAEKSDLGSMIIRDGIGDVAGTSFNSGALGKLIEARKSDAAKWQTRVLLIARGVSISAFGAALQVVGGFGQAWVGSFGGPPA
ncbi:hypothetical protein [Bradyrhizobium sp. NAS96.2]|uniref:hypothetical protein n=1 Tax=Bradyrhizobium sp. NAS96.2 TaxID=1680160 RepID=UPI00093C1EB4|nr:hypothetical protein [Bradyrhizobium sp. NAS96.2]OKO69892.1 hypothetical protein AC628_32245 [Bradyrhizobium sp. NAS96.2]